MNTFTIKNNLIFKTLLLKGMDGATVVSMEKTATSGLVDTYTITYSDGTTEELTVTNGRGISRIDKTSSTGLVDTYTITYNDNTTSTFTIKNGLTTGLSDAQGEPLNVGNTQTPTYFSNGVPVATNIHTNITDETQVPTPWSSITGLSATMRGVAYGNGTFVAVGDSGVNYHSTNGSTWTAGTNAGSNEINDVTYGKGLFVAVGNNGVNYHSTDGATWMAGNTAFSSDLIGVTYGKGLFVAVGNNGVNYHSTDGSTWTAGSSAGSNILYGVTYGNGLFVAVGNNGVNYHSTNGSTWTAGSSAGSNILYGVTYGNGLFVAVGANSVNYRSTDGATWTAGTTAVTTFLYGVTFGNGIFIDVGANTIQYAKVTNAQPITNVGKDINDNTQDIENINGRLGESNISTIGNGTVTGAISSLSTHLLEKNQLVGLPNISDSVTSIKSYTVTKSGFIFAYSNSGTPDDNHTIQYTRNSNNSIQISLLGIPTPYPVCVGDIVTIRGTSNYGSVVYPCGCFSD